MCADLSFQPGSQRFFTVQSCRNVGRLTLSVSQRGCGSGDFIGQCAQFAVEASAIEFDGLKSYEILNECLHL